MTRPGHARFEVKYVDPTLCSDVIFGFVGIDLEHLTYQIIHTEDRDFLKSLLKMKFVYPRLRVILAMGGEEVGDLPFEGISAIPSSLQEFSTNVAGRLRRTGFDGLEVAWTTQDGTKRETITSICKALNEAFQREAIITGQEKLLLTLASLPSGVTPEPLYQPLELQPYLDRITVLGFNYDSLYSPRLAHNNPFHAHEESPDKSCQSASIDWWTRHGVPKQKLLLGLAAFGRSVRVEAGRYNTDTLRSLAKPGHQGQFSNADGLLTYYEICSFVKSTMWLESWDSQWRSPFANGYREGGKEWVSFENPRSFQVKSQFVKHNGLGGIAIWSLDMDDFGGRFCQNGSYPLLRAAAAAAVFINASALLLGEPKERPVKMEIHFGFFIVLWVLCIGALGSVFVYGRRIMKTEAAIKKVRLSSEFF